MLFGKASGRFVLLVDVSGEAHVCAFSGLSLVHTFYVGQTRPEGLCMTEELLAIIEGNSIKVVDLHSGNFIARSLTHQRRISGVAISSLRQN